MRKWLGRSTVLVLALVCLPACLFLENTQISQAEIKALETREIAVSLDRAYTAAIQALFDLGYIIRHSEKEAGIVVGEQQQTTTTWVPGEGNRPGYFRPVVTTYTVTLLLASAGKKKTQLRIKYSVDGSMRFDRQRINDVWVAIDREALMGAHPPAVKK